MRARQRSGSVVLDKRIKTWNFFFWENGKRRSKKIGTVSQYPTKASAWRAAKALRDGVENQVRSISPAPSVSTLVEQYRAEKMPRRAMTRQGYNTWLNQYIIPIIPIWGDCTLQELQARSVGLVRVLWDFAMWRGDVPLQRNPMELVTIKGATKRIRQPRSLTVTRSLFKPYRTIIAIIPASTKLWFVANGLTSRFATAIPLLLPPSHRRPLRLWSIRRRWRTLRILGRTSNINPTSSCCALW